MWDNLSEDNDGLKIQAAIDSAAINGKTVFIPKEKYHIGTTLIIRSGVKLVGAGKINTILMMSKNTSWKDNKDPILRTEGDNCLLSDIAIYGYPGCRLLHVESSNTLVRDVQTETRNYSRNSRFSIDYPYVSFSGNAGGKFYNISTDHNAGMDRSRNMGEDYFLLSIKNTVNPLYLFALSVEHFDKNPQSIIQDSKNVFIHGFKFESKIPGYFEKETDNYCELIHIKNSQDIELFAGSGNYFLDDDTAMFHIMGKSKNVEVYAMVPKLEKDFGPDVALLAEKYGAYLPQERNVLYYKSKDTFTKPNSTSNLSEDKSVLQIYPNPSNKEWVTLSNYTISNSSAQLVVFNTLEKQVFKTQINSDKHQLNLNLLNKGMYKLYITHKWKTWQNTLLVL